MEFWEIEVPAGKGTHVSPKVGQLIHISEVALRFGDVESVKNVAVCVSVDGVDFVVGRLSAQTTHFPIDLVLHMKSFLSHEWKDGSVYFTGYTADEEKLFQNEKQKFESRLIGDGLYAPAVDGIVRQGAYNSSAVTVPEPEKKEEEEVVGVKRKKTEKSSSMKKKQKQRRK